MKRPKFNVPAKDVYAAEARLKGRTLRFGDEEDIAAYELLQRVTRVLCTRCTEEPGGIDKCRYCNGAGYFFMAGARKLVRE
jgi:hypothetical protein